jgi:RNA polymerase sigma-54 factor
MLELRQQLKLTQQLVMTPQLQQAIKLLQLSRMELVDVVREEMLENPVLEEGNETTAEADRSGEAGEEPGERERQPKEEKVKEVEGNESATNEVDWEAYLDSYSMAPRAPVVRRDNDDMPSLEATFSRKPSLTDHLMWQTKMSSFSDKEMKVATLVIGNLDSDGYLKEPPLIEIAESAGLNVEQAESVLRKIQGFDPVGVAARSLSECLVIQARHLGEDSDVLVRMVSEHLKDLEKKNYPAIAKALKQPLEEIYETAKVIMSLDPKPGRQYSTEEPHYITPDVYVHKVGETYFVVPNDDGLPKLKISGYYRKALKQGGENARQYVQDKLRSAQWLIRSIQQRQRTIIRVTESIVKFQREFLDKGIAYLKPMILKDVAEDVGMHESTISRVTTAKYVHTPQGIFELKFFFNSGLSRADGQEVASESVKEKIRQIVARENNKKPYSDKKIAEILGDQGIDIARRTVAKYREQLGILSSSKRKQYF